MALSIGYDEGGSGDILLVSVQVGITEQAKKLKQKWKQRLNGVPYFHSIDLWNFQSGVFTDSGLGRAERSALLSNLADLIHDRLIIGLTAKISTKEYLAHTTNHFRSQHGTAYTYCVTTLILMTYLLMKQRGIRTEFNILIENGHRNAMQAVQILDRYKVPQPVPVPDFKILSVGLGSKVDHPILQAADMLAYCKHQQHTHGDTEIYKALHRIGSPYSTETISLDRRAFLSTQQHVAEWADKCRDYWLHGRNDAK